VTISPDDRSSPPATTSAPRRDRDSTRPPGTPEHRSAQRPPAHGRTTESTSTPTRRASPPGRRSRQRPPAPASIDAVCDGLTVSFEVRYVDGAEGHRVAAAQADAVSALLTWLAHRDDAPASRTGLSDADGATGAGRAA
jgi:hypothetical protein